LEYGLMPRADARRNRERIIRAAAQLLQRSPSTSLADVATAAGVSRSTLHRHFPTRAALVEAGRSAPQADPRAPESLLPTGHLGRATPVSLEAIHAFDAVAPPVLPEQLVAEAQRLAEVPVALYVIDIDGSHLLRVAGAERLPERLPATAAVGPEIDSYGLSELRQHLADMPGIDIVPLWLRGRAAGVFLTLGRARHPLAGFARQAAAAVTLADRYTDAFARTTRRERPTAAAEIQQSLLPPRIARVTGAEVAGNVLPSYEVAGDWFDVVENLDGVWITLADGLKAPTVAAAASAVALGALRASRRSGGELGDALMLMHRTLKEMPGPSAEMTAIATQWDPGAHSVRMLNCGHVPPVILRKNGENEVPTFSSTRGLGGRSAPQPSEFVGALGPGDRLVLVSDGIIQHGRGKAGVELEGLIEAARLAESTSAADTVRKVQTAVLAASGGDLSDDATAVCLAVS
jgi:serine phosphatase RsbU (regulator of sigma subunit)